jgi:hypothetical protein
MDLAAEQDLALVQQALQGVAVRAVSAFHLLQEHLVAVEALGANGLMEVITLVVAVVALAEEPQEESAVAELVAETIPTVATEQQTLAAVVAENAQ